jgi:hypothetical protein
VNEAEISRYITETGESVDVVTDSGNSFFYNPDMNVAPDHRFPFVTLVTSDLYDQFCYLSRPSIFRLNIGIGKQTFRSLSTSKGNLRFPSYDKCKTNATVSRVRWAMREAIWKVVGGE